MFVTFHIALKIIRNYLSPHYYYESGQTKQGFSTFMFSGDPQSKSNFLWSWELPLDIYWTVSRDTTYVNSLILSNNKYQNLDKIYNIHIYCLTKVPLSRAKEFSKCNVVFLIRYLDGGFESSMTQQILGFFPKIYVQLTQLLF